jgi:hypothetical protein
MKIRIEIKQGMIGILLVDKSKILDRISFPEERNLSEKLLPIVDEFLKKNRLSVQDIERMELKSDLDESWTTYRIAKSVTEAFNWARNL